MFRDGSFRFYFFFREEPRMHVHVQCPDGEAEFWLEPVIAQAQNYGLNKQQLRVARTLIEGHADEIRAAWKRHLGG
jgi:hypothetical protein